MKNENSNTGIYDQYLVIPKLIQSRYIFMNTIKPVIDEIMYKNRQKSKTVFLKFLQLEGNFWKFVAK